MSYLNHPDTPAADTADTHHLTASAVVIDLDAQRVLLVHHRGADQWLFPGGHVEPGEAPHETALREIREETGLVVNLELPTIADLPGMAVAPTPLVVARMPAPAWPDSEPHDHTDFLYLATGHADAPLTAQEDEVAGIAWAPLTALHTFNTRAEVPHVAFWALRALTRPEWVAPQRDQGVNTVNVVSGNARVGIQASVINVDRTPQRERADQLQALADEQASRKH